jgi:hypothetical protein
VDARRRQAAPKAVCPGRDATIRLVGKPKRHHYLPESYMRRFAVDDRIWVYDRQRDKVRRDTPHNVAVESEFYTTWTSLGSKETITEERLAELDHAGPIAFDKLERGKRLDRHERYDVAFFLAFAETRGPSSRRALREIDKQTGRIAARRSARHVENAVRRSTDDVRVADLSRMTNDYDTPVVTDRDQEIAIMVETAFELAAKFDQMAWMVGRNVSRTDFITSDRPIAVLPPTGWTGPYGCLMPGVTNIFPLSGRNCLLFGGYDPTGALAIMPMNDDKIDEINRAIARHGDQCVIARHERAVRTCATELRDLPRERMSILELYDAVQDRSFIASYCARPDLIYPFTVKLSGPCPKCQTITHFAVVVHDSSESGGEEGEYTRWLDGNCAKCGVPRRVASPNLEPVW